MALRVVGAGLPRTGTQSLRVALERLLDGPCCHMSAIPGHPFDLGPDWGRALAGGTPDWPQMLAGYVATVDWPASHFWKNLADGNPDALVLLSERESAATWLASVQATILPFARLPLAPDWDAGRDLTALFEAFTGSAEWDSASALVAAYRRHNRSARATVAPGRLLVWRPGDGWGPLCRALRLPVPDEPFPWLNRRENWG